MSQEIVPLGKKITEPHPARDAVHVAVEPVVAGANGLFPGDRVCVVGTDDATGLLVVGYDPNGKEVGILDPFLTDQLQKGDRVYLCCFPNTVTGIKHVWQHPDFPDRLTENEKKRQERNSLLKLIPGSGKR